MRADYVTKIAGFLVWCVCICPAGARESCTVASPGGDGSQPQYDGVGYSSIPRPASLRQKKSNSVSLHEPARREVVDLAAPDAVFNDYERYVYNADMPYQPPREQRIKEVIKERGFKEIRRFFRKQLKDEFDEGVDITWREYEERRKKIDEIGRKEDKLYRFQYDSIDPNVPDRTDPEWDDIALASYGPFVITDTGKLDLQTDWDKIKELWDDGLGDIILVPEPPADTPKRNLLVGDTMKVNTKGKVRISSSRLFNPFYKESPGEWGDHITDYEEYFRYLQVSIGVDFYTPILKRRYCRTELEVRTYGDFRWSTYLNVVLYSH